MPLASRQSRLPTRVVANVVGQLRFVEYDHHQAQSNPVLVCARTSIDPKVPRKVVAHNLALVLAVLEQHIEQRCALDFLGYAVPDKPSLVIARRAERGFNTLRATIAQGSSQDQRLVFYRLRSLATRCSTNLIAFVIPEHLLPRGRRQRQILFPEPAHKRGLVFQEDACKFLMEGEFSLGFQLVNVRVLQNTATMATARRPAHDSSASAPYNRRLRDGVFLRSSQAKLLYRSRANFLGLNIHRYTNL